jgi:hypothetical protein
VREYWQRGKHDCGAGKKRVLMFHGYLPWIARSEKRCCDQHCGAAIRLCVLDLDDVFQPWQVSSANAVK